MFTGLSAFPLTPMDEQGVDEIAFTRLVQQLVAAKVDSIGALGSTGSYAYLSRAERSRVAQLAVEAAEGVPVMVSIGALRTRDVLLLAEDAQAVGVKALLLPPVSYQKLTQDDVFSMYERVSANVSVPLCVYDNPGTTHFDFTDELHGRIAELPNVRSIKIPGVPDAPHLARERVERLRKLIPSHVTIGISGDALAAIGMNAGCDAWYSVMGGLFPNTALAITRAALSGDAAEAVRLSESLKPLWALFRQFGGSFRVIATAAELRGFTHSPSVPLPLRTIAGEGREQIAAVIDALELS
ncbi:dihydrodipicolinate synthase family protein [Pseudomonas hefeiensis]|uniref:Dihydrodipicolinate synthase family protein n=1 Tax=Pseudomonas hefeiensis TaxID=2738125 RepID=A0ABY9GIQ0_9PSED|nr:MULTISPECIES: dihydrodipicolinate synthase family protein [unclassified Pseudomonas]WLH15376.1 dihydrodipicolinate synthase family protein [Pseudomonas sp. FP205]WLH98427.1 dihydrodipicolinate synthase family protein [Pseudomonas sp. FP53]WLI42689.1 dihydrodipicolinate synthase family protein [Pseudomonas sp. FP821]